MAKNNLGNAMPFEIQIATDKLKRKKRRAQIATKQGWAKDSPNSGYNTGSFSPRAETSSEAYVFERSTSFEQMPG